MSENASAAASSHAPTSSPSGGAERLLERHQEAIINDTGKHGRHRRGCVCPSCAARAQGKPGGGAKPTGGAPSPAFPVLPPGAALPEVMGSGASLFFMGHALLLDDPAWNISPQVKSELGNILAWMLHDDFYKMGGLGKYVVGGILCLGVYVAKASETAAGRKRKREAQKLAASGASKLAPSPVQADKLSEVKDESLVSGPMGRLLSSAASKPEQI